MSAHIADVGATGERAGDPGYVARGDHPMRTPVYGGLLIVGAMIGASMVWLSGLPIWLRNLLLVLALVAAIAGWIMTFRDLSQPLRRSRRPRPWGGPSPPPPANLWPSGRRGWNPRACRSRGHAGRVNRPSAVCSTRPSVSSGSGHRPRWTASPQAASSSAPVTGW